MGRVKNFYHDEICNCCDVCGVVVSEADTLPCDEPLCPIPDPCDSRHSPNGQDSVAGLGRSPSGAVPVRAIAQPDLDLIHDESAFTGHTVSRGGDAVVAILFFGGLFAQFAYLSYLGSIR